MLKQDKIFTINETIKFIKNTNINFEDFENIISWIECRRKNPIFPNEEFNLKSWAYYLNEKIKGLEIDEQKIENIFKFLKSVHFDVVINNKEYFFTGNKIKDNFLFESIEDIFYVVEIWKIKNNS